MLAWRDVDDAGESAADGYNVVIHEFAHVHRHAPTASADGDAAAARRAARGRGSHALDDEYERFAERVDARRGHRRSTPTAPKRSKNSSRSPPRRSSSRPRRSARRGARALRAVAGASSAQDPALRPSKRTGASRPPSFCRRSATARPSPAPPSACRSFAPAGCRAATSSSSSTSTVSAAAVDQAAEQQLVGQRAADRVLDQARHRPRAHQRIEALLRQVACAASSVNVASTFFSCSWLFELQQELVDHAQDDLLVERARSEIVASSRLRNSGVNMRLISAISSPACARVA